MAEARGRKRSNSSPPQGIRKRRQPPESESSFVVTTPTGTKNGNQPQTRHFWPLYLFIIFVSGVVLMISFKDYILTIKVPVVQVFHSPEHFMENYAAMEKKFKLYVYPAKQPYSCGDLTNLLGPEYATEIYFFQMLKESPFLTDNPDLAHFFFTPLSCMVDDLELKGRRPKVSLKIEDIVSDFPYWNRTLGADHFFVNCYETELSSTEHVRFLMKNSIQVMCSDSYNSKYEKDVSLPAILWGIDDYPAAATGLMNRTKLGLWDGKLAPKFKTRIYTASNSSGKTMIESSSDYKANRRQENAGNSSVKLCVSLNACAAKVVGSFIAESIHFGCVPVILADNFNLPFNGILDWNKFSVRVKENELNVHLIKKILEGIEFSEYEELQRNMIKVQRHFQWNSPPRRYDAFHMVMYELWLRRHVVM